MSSSNRTVNVEETASVKHQAAAADQHAVATPDDGEVKNTEPPAHASRGRKIAGILVAAALISAIVWGLYMRAANEASVARAPRLPPFLQST